MATWDEYLDEWVPEYLLDMHSYHIDRDVMNNIVKDTIGYENLLDLFIYGEFNQTNSFAWFRDGDEFYIIHKPSGMMINWYKHLGRTNTCSQYNRHEEEYIEFFTLLKLEVVEFLAQRMKKNFGK